MPIHVGHRAGRILVSDHALWPASSHEVHDGHEDVEVFKRRLLPCQPCALSQSTVHTRHFIRRSPAYPEGGMPSFHRSRMQICVAL